MEPHRTLSRAFALAHPDEAASVLERLDPTDARALLADLDPVDAGTLVVRFHPTFAAAVLGGLDTVRDREVLAVLPPRVAADLLLRLEAEGREGILAALDGAAAERIRELLHWPLDTAGALMDPSVVSLPIDSTIGEAIETLRRSPPEAVYYLYVVDRERRLVGVVTLRDVVLAAPRTPLERIVKRDVVSVRGHTDRAELAGLMRGFVALPVVDEAGRLLGVVRHGEVIEAAEEEVAEDLQRMVGAGAEERTFSPAAFSIRKRLPWLIVNLGTAFLAAAVVGLFEEAIARLTLLAVLLPIVAGQAGNTGAQSLAVAIRGLALREILPGRGRRLILREAAIGATNGLVVSAATTAAVYGWFGDSGVAAVIGLAMLVSMAVAGLAGAAIPLALRQAGHDPAQASSIVMTTVTDVVGFASFLGLASLLL